MDEVILPTGAVVEKDEKGWLSSWGSSKYIVVAIIVIIVVYLLWNYIASKKGKKQPSASEQSDDEGGGEAEAKMQERHEHLVKLRAERARVEKERMERAKQAEQDEREARIAEARTIVANATVDRPIQPSVQAQPSVPSFQAQATSQSTVPAHQPSVTQPPRVEELPDAKDSQNDESIESLLKSQTSSLLSDLASV